MRITILSIIAIFFISCGKEPLTSLESIKEVRLSSDSMCVAPPEKKTKWHKIMFIVDKSGSNQAHDPDNLRRADNIDRFIEQHGDDEFTEFSYLVFGEQTGQITSYITDGTGEGVFGDKQDLEDASQRQRQEQDIGCTPYLAALEHSKQIIQKDVRVHEELGEEATYNIFFLSDGFPTDNNLNGMGGCGQGENPVTNDPDDIYLNKVRDLVALSPGRIFFNTVYYTPLQFDTTRAAADGLSYMAEAGNGNFVDLDANDVIDFNPISVGEKPESWIIKRLMVYNVNSAFCSDGSISSDSDADGLCDKDEIEFNTLFESQLRGSKFDPTNRNSIQEKYGDKFVYHNSILPTGEGLEPCDLGNNDEDFDILNECEERTLSDSSANGPTREWTTYLSESLGGTADPKNPDSDGDGFLDFIEYFQFGIRSTPVDYTSLTDSHGDFSAEQLMEEHRHPQSLQEFTDDNYDIEVNYRGVNLLGENCYDIDFNQVPTYSVEEVTMNQVSGMDYLVHAQNENIVLIYYILVRENDPNGKGYLFYSYQKTKHKAEQNFSLNDFKSYKIPETETSL